MTGAYPAIVVTDHDEEYLEMMRDLLIEEGYPRVFCVAGDEFWPHVTREQPGLVVINVSLRHPDDGWSQLDKLRLYPPTVDVPVILCATDTRIITAKAGHLERLNCYVLEKPFQITELLRLVTDVLGPPP